MRLLVAYSAYRSELPSGENLVVETELELLRRAGNEVHVHCESSDAPQHRGLRGAVLGAASATWNPLAERRLAARLDALRPDVLHVHNVFPWLSPAVLSAARGRAVAVVSTLHNYRLFCANGLALRDGRPCLECLDARGPWPGVRHACYRAGTLETLPVAAGLAVQRVLQPWRREADAVICLSRFQRELLERTGLLDPALVHVKGNALEAPEAPLPWAERDDTVVFAGRLTREKGAHLLVDAWSRWGAAAPRLELIGAGDEEPSLRRAAQAGEARDRIVFRGRLPWAETFAALRRARLLVAPSLTFEGFPLAVRDAFAAGVPVLGARLGSTAELVVPGETGAQFAPGDAADLCAVARQLWGAPRELEALGRSARARFERDYAAPRNLEQLLEIYRAAIAHKRAR